MADLSGDPIEVPGLGEIRQDCAAISDREKARDWVLGDALMNRLDAMITWVLFCAFVLGAFLLLGVIS